ncbi:MAG: hypothetical protein WC384_12130 [Prolixibacteraceae bacterium]|jgi:hypothetical protein
MKTIKSFSKVTMLLAFVAFANTLMAAGNLKVNILPLTSEKAVVAISAADAANFKISIENDKGEKVYYKETDADSKDYRKVFDFSNLEKGDYKLSVSMNGLTTERLFKIDNENIAVGKENSLIEPYFAFKDGVLKMSYLNFPEENISLNFYTNDDLVYSKELGNKFNVTEGYDLSKLEKGNYIVVLSTNNKSYTYDLNLE